MSSWAEVLDELSTRKTVDDIRREKLRNLQDYSGRNVIAYYSGFLTNKSSDVSINDSDMNGFMNAVYGLDRTKGLDLILHTPGGTVSATGAIVSYLRGVFGTNIRCMVPQIAMSAGTMTACACKEIVMGKHSSIGPIDPQFGGISCGEILEEFEKAYKEITTKPASIPVWQVMISKYAPAFVGQCQKAVDFSREMVQEWLESGMFANDPQTAKTKATKVIKALGDHGIMKQHDRHISAEEAKRIGLTVFNLEDDQTLQDLLLTVHHSFMLTFSGAEDIVKIIENHLGNAMVLRSRIYRPS